MLLGMGRASLVQALFLCLGVSGDVLWRAAPGVCVLGRKHARTPALR